MTITKTLQEALANQEVIQIRTTSGGLFRGTLESYSDEDGSITLHDHAQPRVRGTETVIRARSIEAVVLTWHP